MCEMGNLSSLQFEDQNKDLISSERPYFSQLKLVREIISRLSSIEGHLKKHTRTDIAPYVSEMSVKNIISQTKQYMRGKNVSEFLLDWQTEVNKMWKTVDGFEKGLQQVLKNVEVGQEFAGLLKGLREELHGGPQIYAENYSSLNNSLAHGTTSFFEFGFL
jgi:hypothetical protein